jgi:Mce-associated membrane protein
MAGPRRTLSVAAAVLALACILLLCARSFVPGALPGSWTAADDAADRDTEITSTARKMMDAFVNLDYNDIDDDTKQVLSYSTGKFRKDYGNDLVELTSLTRQRQAVSTGDVLKVGIGQVDDQTAIVSVAVDTRVTNTTTAAVKKAGKGPGYEDLLYMFKLTMNHVGDDWKVADLEVIR